MSEVRQVLSDTFDASLEMPEGYGSRTYWRWQNLRFFIGLAILPLLFGLSFFNLTKTQSDLAAAAVGMIAVIAIVAFIRRDRAVQRRIDSTGSPLVERTPY